MSDVETFMSILCVLVDNWTQLYEKLKAGECCFSKNDEMIVIFIEKNFER